MFNTAAFAHVTRGKHIIKATLLACAIGLSGAAHAELQPLKIRLASDLVGPPHPAGITMAYLQERLPQVIPGSSMLVYYAGGLYRIPEAVEAMTEGNLEMAFGQFGKTASIEPYMSVVNGPLKLTTPGAMNAHDNFETYKFVKKRMLDVHGVRLFGSAHLSLYLGLGAKFRIRAPGDISGKKFRGAGPAENASMESWGASAISMAFGDVPPALETGVIDGVMTSLGGFNAIRDQIPYFTVAGINGFMGDRYWLGVSEVWWKKLNKETQTAFRNLVVEEAIPLEKKLNWCNDKKMIDKYGTTDPTKPGIYTLSSAESKVFQDKLGTATDEFIKSITPDAANKWVDKFAMEAKAAVAANPLGSDPLEKTDCKALAHWWTKYAKWVRPKKKK